MAYNYEYPYTDPTRSNADWLLNRIKTLSDEFVEFVKVNRIKYSDPIAWNITRQYEQNTVVIDEYTGDAYLSVKPVPVGVNILNTEYWTPIFNYTNSMNELREQIAIIDEKTNTTASDDRTKGQLIWLNGKLYIISADMNAGDRYVLGTNINKTTIEDELTKIILSLNTEIENRESADNLLNNLINNEIEIREKTKYYITPQEFGAVGDGVTDDTNAFIEALEDDCPCLVIPKGTYLITDTLNITKEGQTIIGASQDASIIITEEANLFVIDNVNKVVLKDFTCVGAYGVTDLVTFSASHYFKISNLVLENSKTALAFSESREGYISILTIRQYSRNGMYVYKSNDIFTSQFLFTNEYRTPYGYPSGIGVHLVNKCESVDFIEGDIVGGRQTLLLEGTNVHGRTCPAFCRFTNVYFDSAVTGAVVSRCKMIEFIGCWWSFTGAGYTKEEMATRRETTQGLKVDSSCGITLNGCHIYSNGGDGVVLSNNDFITITNSIIANCNRYEYTDCAGIWLKSGNFFIISNNVISNNCNTQWFFVRALLVDGGTNIDLSNNVIDVSGGYKVTSDTSMSSISVDGSRYDGVDLSKDLGITLAAGQSWTATRNCYMRYNLLVNDTGIPSVSINGQMALRVNGAVNTSIIGLIPINAGDIIVCSSTGGHAIQFFERKSRY